MPRETHRALHVGIACFGHGLGTTGGTQVYLRGLLSALARHDTSDNQYALLIGPEELPPPEVGAKHFSLIRVADPGVQHGQRWRRAWRAAFGACAEIDQLGLDVVHFPMTRLTHPLRRTPVLLTFFDMQEEFLPEGFSRRERFARRLLHRLGVWRARHILAPSSFTADALRQRYAVPARKLTVLPAGFSDRLLAPASVEDADLLRRLALLPGGFALYPANAWPHKNHARLLQAWRALSERPGGAPLLVLTGRVANETRSITALVAAQGLAADRVRDLGFVSEECLAALLRAARVLVFPSLFEGFGLPVLEALAVGCPVVCARLPPLVELAGRAAVYFDPHDPAAIAHAVGTLWDDAQQRAELALHGRARARNYRWDTLVPQLVATYAHAGRPAR